MAATGLTARQWLRLQAGPARHWLRLSAALGVFVGVMTIVQMGLLAWVVSRAISASAPPTALSGAFVALVTVVALRALAQWGQESAGAEASLRIRQGVRSQLLDHIAALGPVRLGGRHSAGLAGQLVEQVEALDGYFARFLPQLTLAAVVPAIILLLVVRLDWLAALFLLLSAPLIPLFMALVGMGAERLNREQFVAVARLAGHFLDRVRGLTTLQLFNRAAGSVDEVYAAADDYRRRSLRPLRLAFLSSAVLEFFSSVAIAAVAIYIGFGLLGYISFGPARDLTLFTGLFILLLAPEFFQPLRTLSQHYHDRAAALGSAEELKGLLDIPLSSQATIPETANDARPVATAISLHGVSIAHVGRGRVLGPLDLRIEAGECVALTGPSGAGKTTLLQLLAGFVDVEQGCIEIAPATPIAWMDQRPWLVQGSIADNLHLVAPQTGDEQLREALYRAGLGELLSTLPEGLATWLGERGLGLSGGQAQRLALARVFLSAAPLVLLDEPTANLDADTEARVVTSLRTLMEEGRTLVVATHHPALMALASRTVMLENGRLVTPSAEVQ